LTGRGRFGIFAERMQKTKIKLKFKAHTAAIIRSLSEHGRSLVITQNGEAKAVTQDVASYEQTQETLALLKILALGNCQILEALKGQNPLAP